MKGRRFFDLPFFILPFAIDTFSGKDINRRKLIEEASRFMSKTSKKPVAYFYPVAQDSSLEAEYLLAKDLVTIGRHPNNIISIQQEAVSRHHAKIERKGDQFVLVDLNSSNGTFINGQKIKSQELKEGDVITLGDAEFGFSYQSREERQKEIPEDTTTVTLMPDEHATSTILTTKKTDATPLPLAEAASADKAELIKANVRLATLYRLSDLLRDANDRQTILDRVMNLIFEVLPADRGVILYRRSAEKGDFEPVTVKYRGDQPITKHSIAISRTIVERCTNEKIAILSRDAKTDDRFKESESIVMHDIRSTMCVPLITKSRVLGVLHVDTRESIKAFTEADLTFLSSLANELAQSLENLNMREQMMQQEKMATIGQTITGVAHNIKNILQLTKGGVQLMDKSLDDSSLENARASWQIVKRGEEKIANFIRDMLDFARTSSGPKKFCNVNAIITEIYESVSEEMKKKNIRLELKLGKNIPDRRFSEDGIYKCLMNLLVNASEAIKHDKGNILIATELSDQDEIVIRVSDNGEGMTPDVMKNLFVPFFTTKGSGGTGLGLCTTRKIVEENKGTSKVDSTYGEGTIFTITFISEDTKVED